MGWLLVGVVLAFWPVLFGHAVFAGGDQEQLLYPYTVFFSRAYASGQGWLSAPTILGGFPIYASLTGGVFAPFTALLVRWLPPLDAYHWLVVFNASVAAGATAAFVSRLGGSKTAQIIAGVSWLISQWPLLPDLAVMTAFSLLPLLLLCVLWAGTSRWAVMGGAAVVGYGWLGVHYQWQLMIFVAAGVFACLMGGRVLRRFAGMWAGGTVLGLPWLLSAFVYLQSSGRSGGIAVAEAARQGVTPLDLSRLVAPHLWWPGPRAESWLYWGILPLILVVCGIAGRRQFSASAGRWFTRLIWLGLGAAATAVMGSPVFWLLHQLPAFNTVRAPERWLFVAAFCAAAAAGLAFDQLRTNIPFWRPVIRRCRMAAMLGLGLLAAGAIATLGLRPTVLAISHARVAAWYSAEPKALPVEHYQRVAAGRVAKILQPVDPAGWAFWAAVLALSASSLALYAVRRGSANIGRWVGLAMAVDLLLVTAPTTPTIPKKIFTATPPTAAILSRLPAGYHQSLLSGQVEWQYLTVPHGYDPIAAHELKRTLLAPNLGMLDGLPTWDGYENLMSRRVSRVLGQIGSDRATVGEVLANAPGTLADKVAVLAKRQAVFDRLGIRYLVSAVPLPEPFTAVATATVTPYAIPVSVYANDDARPFAYVASAVRQLPIDEIAAFTAVLSTASTSPDFMECADCPRLGKSPRGSAQIRERKNTSLTLDVSADAPALVVVLQSFLPGWEAAVDGQPAPLYAVNSVAQGVAVPAGNHTVTLTYRYATVLAEAGRLLCKSWCPW